MRKPRVAIQGNAASFHDQAAQKYFGGAMEILPCNSFDLSCHMLRDNRADYCVIAIENSLAGSILTNYRLISELGLRIIGEVFLRIELHLVALPDVNLEEIRYIRSHPMALRQCAEFLSSHADLLVLESQDTASCVKMIADDRMLDTAAIAGEAAAGQYGLKILRRNIETNRENYTRFFVLSKGDHLEERPDKSTLCFRLDHVPGSLLKALKVFEKYLVNLSRIQSVPVQGQPGEYRFYADAEWLDRELYAKCLKELGRKTRDLQILGEYKRNELSEHEKTTR